MKLIQFTKMHGLGNDFMVINTIDQDADFTREHIIKLADRHFGIGFDQLLLLETSTDAAADFNYRIFNADGNEVEQCGNGARCMARFIQHYQLSTKTTLTLRTKPGLITLKILENQGVEVDMGIPDNIRSLTLNTSMQPVSLMTLSLGNPHAVLNIKNLDNTIVETLGPIIATHDQFPDGINVGFMNIINQHHIRLRVYERGVGETLACGTGACAAVVAAHSQHLLDATTPVTVQLPGGSLHITWQGPHKAVIMSGPAEIVFEGRIEIP